MNFTHFDTEFTAFSVGSMVKPYPMFPAWPNEYPNLDEHIYRAYPNANDLVFAPTIYPQEDPPHQ